MSLTRKTALRQRGRHHVIASQGEDVSQGPLSISIATVCVFFVALTARLSPSGAAEADMEPLRVAISAPATCPASPSFLERVRRHTAMARNAKPREPARMVHVTIAAQDDRGFLADLELVEDSGRLDRRVPGRTCEDVLAAVALIVALTIDSQATATAVDGGVSAEPAEPEAPDATAPVRPLPQFHTGGGARRPAARSRPRIRTGLGASLEAQGFGELVLGRALWVEATLATRAAPSLRLRLARAQSFTVEPAMRPAFFQLSTAALEGCATLLGSLDELHDAPHAAELRPCAQATAGAFEGASSAFGRPHRMTRAWVSVGGLLQARWRFFGPLVLEAGAGFTVPLVRDDFFFLPRIDVYRAPPAVLVGNVGVGATFR